MARTAKPVSSASADDHIEQYNDVVDRAEISAVQLLNIDFDVSPRYYANERKENIIGYEVRTEESFYDQKEGFAACLVSFDVEAKDDEGPTLECKARYTVSYRISKPCDEKSVKVFLDRVGVFACYPYFRGLFANLDWAANTRLPPLPVHKENVTAKTKRRSAKRAGKKAEAAQIEEG